MSLLRRTLVLALVATGGISLLAPLAASSAAPVSVVVADRLVAIADVPTLTADRGRLAGRQGISTRGSQAAPPEQLSKAPLPSPSTAAMEATLVAVATPEPAPGARTAVTSSGASVWDDLARCEAGGNWAIDTGNGYYGGLQFSHPTWHGHGGGEFADYPHEATRQEQIVVAERLRAARGYQPWPSCRAKLGLP